VVLANLGSESETCWKSCLSCWSLHLVLEEFLSALIHSPPLWFAVSVLQSCWTSVLPRVMNHPLTISEFRRKSLRKKRSVHVFGKTKSPSFPFVSTKCVRRGAHDTRAGNVGGGGMARPEREQRRGGPEWRERRRREEHMTTWGERGER
jgi:hypothetical protein